jgi:hypothetical protein
MPVFQQTKGRIANTPRRKAPLHDITDATPVHFCMFVQQYWATIAQRVRNPTDRFYTPAPGISKQRSITLYFSEQQHRTKGYYCAPVPL